VRLGDVMDIQLGKMLSPAAKVGTTPKPYLRNANVQWGRFDLADVALMDFNDREQAKFRLRRGDLLVCEGGEPGRAAVWGDKVPEAYYQKALHRLRPKLGDVDPHFMMYRLWLGAQSSEFGESRAKTTIAHLPAVRLQELRIALPPLPEQRRIVAHLTGQFAVVERVRKAAKERIDACGEATWAILRSSLSSASQHATLGDCLDEVSSGIGSGWREYPVLGATRLGLAPAKEAVGRYPERYKLVLPGTVFYNPMRILLGSIAMVDDGESAGITSPDYVVVRPRDGILHHRWFYYWLRSPLGADFIKKLARGAVRERILFGRLAGGRISIPPWSAQEIAVVRTAAEAELAAIQALPAVLLREALSGAQ